MSGPATGVRFAGVRKHYGDVVALDGLDLDVHPGELLVLVGPSGSGKSTALRLLAGLEALTAGALHIGATDVSDLPPQARDIAMVFQDYALYPHLTARENLAFGLRVRRVDRAEQARAVPEVAGQLGLDGLLERYPDQLSGGQRQRVALGRALLRRPAVQLMDEPLANLDAQLRLTARTEIVELQRRVGTTTVYVTHDQVEAMTVGDRVAVLVGGRLEQVGTPEEVYDRPASVVVAGFIGSPPMNLVAGGGVLGGAAGTMVGIRPEDLRVDADGALPVTAGVVEALGSETVVHVRAVDGTRLAVRTGPRSTVRPGDALCLDVDGGRSHRFDAATGRRR